MIKITNPVALCGVIMIEYRGNNERLINSQEGHSVIPVKLQKTCKLHTGEIERICFKIKVYGNDLLIVLDGCLVYLISHVGDEVFHIQLTESVIAGFRTFKCANRFIITTTLNYYNVISETDSRRELFNLTLIFKDGPEINNLFI